MAGDPQLGATYAARIRDYAAALEELAGTVSDPNHDAYCARGIAVGQAAVEMERARRPWRDTVPNDYPREDTSR